MNYDSYLSSCEDRYMEECFCEPEYTEKPTGEFSGTYNCEYCDNKECKYWSDFNE